MRRTDVSRRYAAICAGVSIALTVAQARGAAPTATPTPTPTATPTPTPAIPTPTPINVGGRTVTLEDCVAIAVRESPDVKSRDADVAVAEADRANVKGAFGPKLSATAAILGNTSATLASRMASRRL